MVGTNGHGAPVCGAKTRAGGTCQRAPMIGRKRCWMHGGSTPRGLALPQTTHGRYSKDLPTRLAARYMEAANDPDLLELNSEIGLVDTRLSELLARIDTRESGAVWAQLQARFQDLQTAMRGGLAADTARALVDMDQLFEDASRDYLIWSEIGQQVEQRRKLVESERKRRVEMQQMITAEKAMLLIVRIGAIIRDHVTDPGTLDRLNRAFDQLINQDVASAAGGS